MCPMDFCSLSKRPLNNSTTFSDLPVLLWHKESLCIYLIILPLLMVVTATVNQCLSHSTAKVFVFLCFFQILPWNILLEREFKAENFTVTGRSWSLFILSIHVCYVLHLLFWTHTDFMQSEEEGLGWIKCRIRKSAKLYALWSSVHYPFQGLFPDVF